jgi:hypothetical protein
VDGLITGLFSIYAFGTEDTTAMARKSGLRPLLAILAAIVGMELVLGLTGFLSPAPYALGNVLVTGWYPEILPHRNLAATPSIAAHHRVGGVAAQMIHF